MNSADSQKNINDDLQEKRNKIKLSLEVCENVLDDFTNLIFVEDVLKDCEKRCYDQYSKIFKENERDVFFNFKKLKEDFVECTSKCDDVYQRIIDHQIKGAEISYFTYQKHLNKCKDLNRNDPEKLLSCYNYKVEKIIKRFGSYYFNQRINLVNRLNKE